MQAKVVTSQELLLQLPEEVKEKLYQHFQGAADPDKLIYIASLYANNWINDPEVNYGKVTSPKTGVEVLLQVLDLKDEAPNPRILFDFWRMQEILPLLIAN